MTYPNRPTRSITYTRRRYLTSGRRASPDTCTITAAAPYTNNGPTLCPYPCNSLQSNTAKSATRRTPHTHTPVHSTTPTTKPNKAQCGRSGVLCENKPSPHPGNHDSNDTMHSAAPRGARSSPRHNMAHARARARTHGRAHTHTCVVNHARGSPQRVTRCVYRHARAPHTNARATVLSVHQPRALRLAHKQALRARATHTGRNRACPQNNPLVPSYSMFTWAGSPKTTATRTSRAATTPHHVSTCLPNRLPHERSRLPYL